MVWQFFTLPEGQKKISAKNLTYNLGGKVVSRGNVKQYSMGTTGMRKQLHAKYPCHIARAELHRQRKDDKEATTSTASALPLVAPGQLVALDQLCQPIDIVPEYGHVTSYCDLYKTVIVSGEKSVTAQKNLVVSHKYPLRS